jgi:hypothetical protein
MEPNQNPPCEREWTIFEREEFFAGQDAVTGIFNVAPTGIHVTHITPPAQGWPIAMHCPICRETTFLLSPWAAKPEKGDCWRMTETCGSDLLCEMHNIQMAYGRINMEILKYPINPKSICGYYPLEDNV